MAVRKGDAGPEHPGVARIQHSPGGAVNAKHQHPNSTIRIVIVHMQDKEMKRMRTRDDIDESLDAEFKSNKRLSKGKRNER